MPSQTNSLKNRAVLGATAAVVAANLMTVLRMFARRYGYIDKTVPQAMEDWLLDQTGENLPHSPVANHVLDQALHMGYASGVGALDGLLQDRIENPYLRGLALGAGTWAFAGFVLLPALGASKPAWQASREENLVNLSAHLLFGVAAAVLDDEFRHQPARGPEPKWQRELARVG